MSEADRFFPAGGGGASAPPRPARRRLLLVDDELAVAKFVAHAAEECGYEAIVTVTAESFQSQYRALAPAVVVLDLALPRSDGVELLRFLAEEKCTARVVLLTMPGWVSALSLLVKPTWP